jgi:hypothetical protein
MKKNVKNCFIVLNNWKTLMLNLTKDKKTTFEMKESE